jgi:hypothetical protein
LHSAATGVTRPFSPLFYKEIQIILNRIMDFYKILIMSTFALTLTRFIVSTEQVSRYRHYYTLRELDFLLNWSNFSHGSVSPTIVLDLYFIN